MTDLPTKTYLPLAGEAQQRIADALMERPSPAVHTVLMKRGFGHKAFNMHYVARHADVMAMLTGDELKHLSASHYDSLMHSATRTPAGPMDFLLGNPAKKTRRWEILRAALSVPPAMERRDGSDFAPYAQAAVRDAVKYLRDTRRENDDPNFDAFGDYGRVAAALAASRFTGVELPLKGKPLGKRAARFMMISQAIFGQAFANLGDRAPWFRLFARLASKRLRRMIARSAETPMDGSLLSRLAIVRPRFPDLSDAEFNHEATALAYEISGTIQLLVSTSFANMIDAANRNGMDVAELSQTLRTHGLSVVDEALRLVPTTPQVYRKVVTPFSYGGVEFQPGDYVCTIFSAASRDPDVFPLPGSFATGQDPDLRRDWSDYLNFGPNQDTPNAFNPKDGQHPCFGQYWARHLLMEMVHGLAMIEGAKMTGPVKRMAGLPSHLPMTAPFDAAERAAETLETGLTQNLYTVLTEIRPTDGESRAEAEAAVHALAVDLGNPASDRVASALRKTGILHFCSLTVIPGHTAGEPSFLVFEYSVDGPEAKAIDTIVDEAGDYLLPVYKRAGAVDRLDQLADHMKDNSIDLTQSPWPAFLSGKRRNGLGFCGTQGLSQARILGEARLSDEVKAIMARDHDGHETPLQTLQRVRRTLEARTGAARELLWPMIGSKPPEYAEDSRSPWVQAAPTGGAKPGLGGMIVSMAPKMFPRPLLPFFGLVFLGVLAIVHSALSGTAAPGCGPDCARIPPWLFDAPPGNPPGGWFLSPTRLLLTMALAMVFAIVVSGIISGVRRALRPVRSFGFTRMGSVVWFSAAFAAFAAVISLHAAGHIDIAPLERPDLLTLALPGHWWIGVIGLTSALLVYSLIWRGVRVQGLLFAAFGTFVTVTVFALVAHLQWVLFSDALPGGVINRWSDATLATKIFYPVLMAAGLGTASLGLVTSWPSLDMKARRVKHSAFVGALVILIALTSFTTMAQFEAWLGDWRRWGWDWFVLPGLIASAIAAAYAVVNKATAGRKATPKSWIVLVGVMTVLIGFLVNAGDYAGPESAALLTSLALAIPIFVVVAAIGLGGLGALIRYSEKRNLPSNPEPETQVVAEIMARENQAAVQNHMASVVRLVPSPFRRRVTLPLALRIVLEALLNGAYRPGFLGSLGTVQYARWIHLPRTNNYVFYSNYDGSFESYLEDFITKASFGMTGVWSHSVGFPETKFLFFGGSEDGDRFKRYARGSMIPTPFWFSAYPNLSGEQVRRNALIRDGLARIETASDAAAWIELFGSTSRPDTILEDDKVQSLMFSGAGKLKSGACLAVLPDADVTPEAFRDWLCTVEGMVTYGDAPPMQEATFVALGRRGMDLLGFGDDIGSDRKWTGSDEHDGGPDRVRFPTAFALGMDHPSRAMVLGDAGEDAPSEWDWGSGERDAAAVLLIYGRGPKEFEALLEDHRNLLKGIDPTGRSHLVRFEDMGLSKEQLREKGQAVEHESTIKTVNREMLKEPFGFADGVSQPIIEGSYKAMRAPADSIHKVKPGEFILGYHDNRGYYPPSPEVEAVRDPDGHLPAVAADQPLRYPKFAADPGDRRRDLGRNGTFLVIRQLEQDVELFHEKTVEMARTYCPHMNPVTAALGIQAKMVGRWQGGQSFEENPIRIRRRGDNTIDMSWKLHTDPTLDPENEFLFAQNDPQGDLCPFGSHIRRAFPRDGLDPDNPESLAIANRHRLMRRGRAYAEVVDGKERVGTFFVCLNASIERQFEFIQQTWVGSPKFHTLTDEVDPITAQGVNRMLIDSPDKESWETDNLPFTIQAKGRQVRLEGLSKFVRMRGGGYFFLPGRDALRFFCHRV